MKKKKEAQTSSKFARVFKSTIGVGLKVLTVFIPQTKLATIAGGIAIWAVESLVKNSKSTVDDKVLDLVKKELKK